MRGSLTSHGALLWLTLGLLPALEGLGAGAAVKSADGGTGTKQEQTNPARTLPNMASPPAISRRTGGVPLHLEEAGGVSRQSWPVTSGVPFPQGALREISALTLRDPGGKPAPLQVEALCRWPDGSVKWLLLDFPADVGANQTARYTLESGAAPPESPPQGARVAVHETPTAVTVDTGPLRFTIDRRRFGPFARVELGGVEVWSGAETLFIDLEHAAPGPPQEENWLRDAGGGPRDRYTADECRVTVEQRGPQRATVRIEGWHMNAAATRFAPYVVRLYAYAGQSFVRVLHTFTYTGEVKRDFVRAMGWRFPALPGPASAAFGLGRGTQRVQPRAEAPVSLTAIGPPKFYHLVAYGAAPDVRCRLAAEAEVFAEETDAPGWVDVSGASAGVTLSVRDFRRQHPKELRADADGRLTLYFWPESGGKVLDLRRRYDEVDNDHHYDLFTWPQGGRGLAKTHEFWLDFHTGPGKPEDCERFNRAGAEPLWAYVTPEWCAATGVFGRFHPRDPQRFPRLEAQMDFALAWIRRNQRAFQWDGMIDFGDTFFHGYGAATHAGERADNAWGSRGYVGWLNNDGDLVQSLFLHYLRSGDRRVLRMAEAMARHVMDVDTCHFDPDEPARVGGAHRHDQQHWGSILVSCGAAFHGCLDLYLLTGDARALDVAREYGSYHMGKPGGGENRYSGLMRLWDVTGDERCLEAARKVLANELSVPPDQAWPFNTHGYFFRFITHNSVGYVLADAVSPDPRLHRAIVRGADAMAEKLLSSWRRPTYMPEVLVAEAHRLTGDKRYVPVIHAMVKALKVPPLRTLQQMPSDLDGIPFEQFAALRKLARINNIYAANYHHLATMPYLLAAMAEAGVTEADCDAFKPVRTPHQPFEEELDPQRIGKANGRQFVYTLKHESPSDMAGGPSTLKLYEDGKPLGPAHSSHADIAKLGGGRWAHWGRNAVQFSTSDNSDPRTNGRKYLAVQK